jgi:uncharacterized membrane protein
MLKKNNKLHLKSALPFLVISVFTLGIILFYLSALMNPLIRLPSIEKQEDWLYYSAAEPEAKFDSNYVNFLPNISANENLVMERQITAQHSSPTLLLIGDHQKLSVYLDKKLLYSNRNEVAENLVNPGKTLSFVTLPENYQQQTLRIYVSSPFKNYSGYPAEVFLGSSNALVSYVFRHSIPNIFMLLLTGFISLLNLIYVGIKLVKKRQLLVANLLFSAFALSAGLEAGFGDILGGLLFSPTINSVMLNILSIITPLFLIGFYLSRMEFLHKKYKIWVIFHGICGLFAILSVFSHQIHLPEIMDYIHLLNIFSTFVTSFAAIYEAVKKNPFFVLCSPWIVLTAIGHCFIYIQDVLNIHQSKVNWNTIFFVVLIMVCWGYDLMRLFFYNEGKAKKQDIAGLKIRLYEEQQPVIQQQINQWQQAFLGLRKQLTTAKVMLEDNSLMGAFDQIHLMEQKLEESCPAKSEDHSLTTLLLASYQKSAQQKSIEFSHDVDISAIKEVSEEDFLQLFAHLLDYALRETYLLKDRSLRKIHLRAVKQQNQLFVSCQFPTMDPSEKESMMNVETIEEENYFDLQIIEKLTQQNFGTYSLTQEKQLTRFSLTFSSDGWPDFLQLVSEE